MLKFAIVLAAAASPAAMAQVVLSDGDFVVGTWALEIVQQGGGGNVTASVSATGNPGNARRVTNAVNAAPGSTVYGFHRFGTTLGTRYDPATQGPVGSISMSLDARFISGFGEGQGVTLAIKQGQVIYRTGFRYTGSSGEWVRIEAAFVQGRDFTRLDGQPGDPDFSSSGQPIRFGFITTNVSAGGILSMVADYDNFRVEVSPPCIADANHDGGIDGADVESFFHSWEAGDAAADVNADGGVDGGDVATFFIRWESGGC